MIVCVMSHQTVQTPPVIAAGCVTLGVMVAVCDTQGTSQWNKAPPLYRTETDAPPSGPKFYIHWFYRDKIRLGRRQKIKEIWE